MITYEWNVVQLEAYAESNVVFAVHWRLDGGDGEYAGSVYGCANVPTAPDGSFTPYDELTQDQVIGWVKASLGQEQIALLEANVAAQIDEQANPKVVAPPLPW